MYHIYNSKRLLQSQREKGKRHLIKTINDVNMKWLHSRTRRTAPYKPSLFSSASPSRLHSAEAVHRHLVLGGGGGRGLGPEDDPFTQREQRPLGAGLPQRAAGRGQPIRVLRGGTKEGMGGST